MKTQHLFEKRQKKFCLKIKTLAEAFLELRPLSV